MNQKKKIFLHVGYPKTGTTSLQKHYFPFAEGVDYLGKRYSGEKFLVQQSLINEMVFGKSRYNCSSQKLYEFLNEKMLNNTALISEERIIGSFITPRRMGPFRYSTTDPAYIINKIKEIFHEDFFDLFIIITLRKQDDLIPSKYAQSFLTAYSKCSTVDTFSKFVDDIVKNSNSSFQSGFDFYRIISEFIKVFGRKHVIVLPYELFKHNSSNFILKLSDYLECDFELHKDNMSYENVRINPDGSRDYRKSNVSLLKKIKTKMTKSPGTIALTYEQKESLMTLYHEYNRRLDEELELNLKKFGYY